MHAVPHPRRAQHQLALRSAPGTAQEARRLLMLLLCWRRLHLPMWQRP